MLQLLEVKKSKISISYKFKNWGDNFTWVFSGVYGPPSCARGDSLWEELGAILGLWGEPWCVGEDFNVTHFPEERNREGRIIGSMRRFFSD